VHLNGIDGAALVVAGWLAASVVVGLVEKKVVDYVAKVPPKAA